MEHQYFNNIKINHKYKNNKKKINNNLMKLVLLHLFQQNILIHYLKY